MNRDAGRGNWLFVTLRLESGEELPFFVDTGTDVTCFDKSLEPKLGNPRGKGEFLHYGHAFKVGIYAPPKLWLGNTPLMTGDMVVTVDFRQASSDAGRPVMGLLGMDCLRHYCLQMDFDAGKVVFLDPNQLDRTRLGRAYPLNPKGKRPFIHHTGFLGGPETDWLIDTGNAHDGDLESGLFKAQTRRLALRTGGTPTKGAMSDRAWLPNCVWGGEPYRSLIFGGGMNSIGLRFLARHLVTLDFPNRTMYVAPKSSGPLAEEKMQEAVAFLQDLRDRGHLPGWSKGYNGTIGLEAQPNSETYDFRNEGDSCTCHYRITRSPKDNSWQLQKAWRTDGNDRMAEEYKVP